jgi:hypothetical protein
MNNLLFLTVKELFGKVGGLLIKKSKRKKRKRNPINRMEAERKNGLIKNFDKEKSRMICSI